MARRHRRLRQQAAAQAQAEYGPQADAIRRQIQGTRRDERRGRRSARSMGAALQDAIDSAMRDVRHNPNILGHDESTALASLAASRLSAAAGANFLERSVHADAADQRSELRSALVDLSAQQGAAESSALAQLIADKKARQQEQADAMQQHKWDVRAARQSDARQARTAAEIADATARGGTPSQQHTDEAKLQSAQAAAKTLVTQNGIPSTAEDWAALEQLVATAPGVGNAGAAATVIDDLKRRWAAVQYAQQAGQAAASGQPIPQAPGR